MTLVETRVQNAAALGLTGLEAATYCAREPAEMASKFSNIAGIEDFRIDLRASFQLENDEWVEALVARNGDMVIRILPYSAIASTALEACLPPGRDGMLCCTLTTAQPAVEAHKAARQSLATFRYDGGVALLVRDSRLPFLVEFAHPGVCARNWGR